MLPDYIIYDELERLRREEQPRDEERPYLELPLYMPLWEKRSDAPEAEENDERGVIIMQM